nr:hypothetical protein [Bacilli bacterium]
MSVESILEEVCKMNDESAFPLSKSQVGNVLNRLLEYRIDDDILKTALEYSVRMRSIIVFLTTHMQGYAPMYNYYTNLDYPIRRVLGIMGVLDEITEPNLYEDDVIKAIKINLDAIEFELREEVKTNEKVIEIKKRRNYAR